MKNLLLMLIFFFAVTSMAFAEYGLTVGAQAPDFTVKSTVGDDFVLTKAYAQGPVVLLFYRGGWCHYCNIQLKDYSEKIDRFNELGANVYAISVDKIDKAKATISEKEYLVELLSNPEASVLEDYNLIYKVPENLSKMYKEKYEIDLKEASGRDDGIIAIPATVVIDTTGEIVYFYSNEDYKIRPKINEVIKVLKGL